MTRTDLLIKRLERAKRQELEARCRQYAAIINRMATRKRR